MMTLRARTASGVGRIVGWVPDAAGLYLFTGPLLAWPLTEAQLIDLERTPGLSAWTLVDESVSDEPIGQVEITLSGVEARLSRVIVDPARRGEGFGTLLARLALEKAWEFGATRVRLNVIVGNTPAIRIYEGLGFVADGDAGRPDVLSMAVVRPRGA